MRPMSCPVPSVVSVAAPLSKSSDDLLGIIVLVFRVIGFA